MKKSFRAKLMEAATKTGEDCRDYHLTHPGWYSYEHQVIGEIYYRLRDAGFGFEELGIEEGCGTERNHFDLAYFSHSRKPLIAVQIVPYRKEVREGHLDDVKAFWNLDKTIEKILVLVKVGNPKTDLSHESEDRIRHVESKGVKVLRC